MALPSQQDDLERDVAAVRRFNRFYTQKIGVLSEGLLNSRFTLTEARVLFELAQRDGLTASTLGRELGLDAGYLSRILAGFEKKKLLTRRAAPEDGRRQLLTLTGKGRQTFAPLDEASRAEIASLLRPLAGRQRHRLIEAMGTIAGALGDAPEPETPRAAEVILRDPRPGDLGWIVHRQSRLYTEEHGWDGTFEALLAEIAANFARNFDATGERCWIAERQGDVLGSIFLVRESATEAKLRMLYVEPSARGLGVGRKLVEACVAQARTFGYKTLTLWTNDILHTARRIYEAQGFTLVKEERHHSFGKDLVGQYWRLAL